VHAILVAIRRELHPHGRLIGLLHPRHHGIPADHGIGHARGLERRGGSQQPVPHLLHGPLHAVECQEPIGATDALPVALPGDTAGEASEEPLEKTKQTPE
jgi:hypothetical protein